MTSPARTAPTAADDVTVVGVDDHRGYVRSSADAVRTVIGLALVAVGTVVAGWAEGTVIGIESDLAEAIARLPNRLEEAVLAIAQLTAGSLALAVFVYLLVTRHFRAALLAVVGFLTAGWLLGVIDQFTLESARRVVVEIERPSGPLFSDDWPTSPAVASLVALVVVVSPWLTRRWRRATIGLVTCVFLLRVVSTEPAFDLVLATGVGLAVGSLLLLLHGTPDRRPRVDQVIEALQRADLCPQQITELPRRSPGADVYRADVDGRPVRVAVRSADDRSADLVSRWYRYLRRRDANPRRFGSLRRRVEHEVLLLHQASQAGASVPGVVAFAVMPDDSVMLAEDQLAGSSLDKVPPPSLAPAVASAWRQVAALQSASIAHKDLRADAVIVGPDGNASLTDFDAAELSASPFDLSVDIAQMLVATAQLVGEHDAVRAALSTVGPDRLESALPLLQPLALPRETRETLDDDRELLARLSVEASAAVGAEEVDLERLERITPGTLFMIAALAVSFYVLLPQLASVGDTVDAFAQASYGWLPLAIVGSALTYGFAALSLVGSTRQPIPYLPALRAQVAASFTGLVAPAKSGGIALNVRFLQKAGLSSTQAGTAVGLNTIAGIAAHLTLMIGFFTWAGNAGVGGFGLPNVRVIGIVALVVLATCVIALALPVTRRIVVAPTVRVIRLAASSLADVFRTPQRVLLLLGGATALTLSYVLTLAVTVQAFGGGLTFPQIGAAYLGAAAVASAAPTPGGLGAVEAATVAALGGFGMPSAAAVPAVLTFRLATFWLPIAPGYLSLEWMRRRSEI
jgi:glycosyltransferase 2 family protein